MHLHPTVATLRHGLPPTALIALTIALASTTFLGGTAAVDEVTVTGVAANHSSVRIYFEPVPGAKDYRAYDISDPNEVKYAGLTNVASRVPVPATQIDWNLVGDGKPHSLVVEAVDELGPVPQGNLYDPDTNAPLFGEHSHGAMLGGNKGPTLDGRISTNGQGPYTNSPRSIAESRPFEVRADPTYRPVPSTPRATSTFLDTFDNSEGQTLALVGKDINQSTMQYVINSGTKQAATIQYQHADVLNSMPFISANHFMDVLFDGGTPGSNNPLHQGRAVMAFSPQMTATWRPGEILHVTQEVDGHVNDRRWMDIVIVPASDPVVGFNPFVERLNASNQGLILSFTQSDQCTLDIYRGSAQKSGVANDVNTRLWGALGQAPIMCAKLGVDDAGYDVRGRYDMFLGQERIALFVDGKLIQQSAIPAGALPWANQPVKVYYTHYVYHTDNDIGGMRKYACTPLNAFWFNDPVRGTGVRDNACGIRYEPGFGFPRSDERHWDNLGFEMLPRTLVDPRDFSSLADKAQPPSVKAPRF